jgi:hypothetical protein
MFSSSSPGARRSGNRGRRRNNHGPAASSFSWGTTLVTTAFVAYGTYKLANWIYDAWMEDENEKDHNNNIDKDGNTFSAEQNRDTTPSSTTTSTFRNFNSNRTWLLRRQRMKRCRQETIQALQGFLPTLGRIVEEQTKTTLETHALKKIRSQRRKQQQQQQLQSPGTAAAAAASPSGSNKGDWSAAATGHDGEMSPPVTPLKDDELDKINDCNNINSNINREQEVQLWNVIKIQSFTRLMATAYAHTVLFLVLTVQVHLLGAHLWNEQLLLLQQQQQQLEQGEFSTAAVGAATTVSSPSSSSAESSNSSNENCDDNYSYQESHRYVLLHTYEYFFEQGLGLLIQTVERAVEQVLSDWNVLDAAFLHVSHATLDRAIDQIRMVVEELHSTSSSSSNNDEGDPVGGGAGGGLAARRRHCPRNLLRFLMPPTATSSDQKSSYDEHRQGSAVDAAAAGDAKSKDALKVAQAILDETWDLLESPVLKDAQQDCLNATFDLLRQESWGPIFHNETTNADDHHHQGEATTTTTRPLAHILTQLKKASSSFYATVNNDNSNQDMATVDVQPIVVNSYCQAMEQLPSVLEVGDVSFN